MKHLGLGLTSIVRVESLLNQIPPSVLTSELITSTSVELNWIAGSGNDGYSIERSTNGFDFVAIDTVNSNTLTYTDSLLTAGKTYWYRVRGYKNTDYTLYTNQAYEGVLPDNTSLHMNANSITGLSNNDPVAEWTSVDINNYVASQATESMKPIYITNGINGKPCIKFTRANSQLLTIPHNANLNFQNPGTILIVQKPYDTSVHSRILYKASAYSFGIRQYGYVIATAIGIKDYNNSIADTVKANEASIIGMRFGADYDPNFIYNGSRVQVVPGTVDFNNSTNALQIGGNTNVYFDGELGEILVWNRELSASEIRAATAYLNKKWGLSAALYDADLISTTNATSYLTTPTPDETGSAIHPSIVYNADGWNGYKYWMGITPFYQENVKLENPSILVNNDGETWVVPTGLANPLVSAPAGDANNFNSDVEIVFSSDGLTLYCFYRENIGTAEKIYAKSSTDGVNWSESVEILSGNLSSNYQSPSIVWNGSKYRLYVNDAPTSAGIAVYESDNLITGWVKINVCRITGDEQPAHIDINYEDGCYHMWSMNGARTKIMYAASWDGISWVNKYILDLSISGWDNHALYRSTALKLPSGWKLWYSGTQSDLVWRIGKTDITVAS